LGCGARMSQAVASRTLRAGSSPESRPSFHSPKAHLKTHGANSSQNIPRKNLEGSSVAFRGHRQVSETLQSNLVRISHSCEHSPGTMLGRVPVARSMLDVLRGRALMTVLLCIFEQAFLGPGLVVAFDTRSLARSELGSLLPVSLVANVVVASLAWIIVGLITPS
jgi:hypothetical protein